MSNIRIDGEFFEVEHTYGNIVNGGRARYTLFASREEAGEEARTYWQDMAERDPTEFRHMVGDETLVAWALGQYAGPGSTKATSLSEWLDLWLNTPEEHFASYDGDERDVKPPTADERARADFIVRLDVALEEGGYVEDGSDGSCIGINLDGETYWLMEEGFKGAHGTRFSATPYGEAIGASKDDLHDALYHDEVGAFVNGWDELVEELGFTPTVAYRSN
jgi:hypothetical protein